MKNLFVTERAAGGVAVEKREKLAEASGGFGDGARLFSAGDFASSRNGTGGMIWDCSGLCQLKVLLDGKSPGATECPPIPLQTTTIHQRFPVHEMARVSPFLPSRLRRLCARPDESL